MRKLELLGILAVLLLCGVAHVWFVLPGLRGLGCPGWLAALVGPVGGWFIGGSIGKALIRTMEKRRKNV